MKAYEPEALQKVASQTTSVGCVCMYVSNYTSARIIMLGKVPSYLRQINAFRGLLCATIHSLLTVPLMYEKFPSLLMNKSIV